MGMKMTAAKYTSFEIKQTKNSWYIADPDLHLEDGAQIPFSAADSALTHLGGYISPLECTTLQESGHQARRYSTPPSECSHQPHQKLILLTTFIIPHFLYATTLPVLPITIRTTDSLISAHVKDFLHLPASNPNGLLYGSKRDV